MLTIRFAEQEVVVDQGSCPFAIGREGDLRVDDNPFLHRRFLEIHRERDLWWLINVGGQLAATLSDEADGMTAWLAPGGRMPLVFETTFLRFTAGPTTYELELSLDDSLYTSQVIRGDGDGQTTVGRVDLTVDQMSLLVALAETVLRRNSPGPVELPTSAQAARRLGWTQKKFEKKLDNVCEKLTALGVRGLKGELGNLASNRRARLVEYALAARLVSTGDLQLLDRAATWREGGDDEPDAC